MTRTETAAKLYSAMRAATGLRRKALKNAILALGYSAPAGVARRAYLKAIGSRPCGIS